MSGSEPLLEGVSNLRPSIKLGRKLAPDTPFEPISRRLRSGLKYLGVAWSKLAHEIKRLTGFHNGVNRTIATEHFSDTEVT